MTSLTFFFRATLISPLFSLSLSLQVTKGMFGARKKFVEFVEVVDNDFSDESMYYNQPSMFPHRSDKDVSFCTYFVISWVITRGAVLLSSYSVLSSNVFPFRCSPPPPHRRRVSCRSSVRVCMVHKVSLFQIQTITTVFPCHKPGVVRYSMLVKTIFILRSRTRLTNSWNEWHWTDSCGCLTVSVCLSVLLQVHWAFQSGAWGTAHLS